MIFDFSKLRLKERPTLILETLSGRKIQSLGYAIDITPHLSYNDVSTLTFSYPREVDGRTTPHYDDLRGWNVIEWKDLGRFILMDPQTTYENGHETKECTAYSLEFEWISKQIYLDKMVYNFWNPVTPENTILGRIMERVPNWKLGTVDGTLIGIYHSFDVQQENLYNFVKSTIQETINCIFEFDTMTRTVNVRDVSSRVHISPIFLSTKNLLNQIQLSEDSQNVITAAVVRGAEGVNIGEVNPTGELMIYNLNYFMDDPNQFTPTIVEKYKAWELQVKNMSEYYYQLMMECYTIDSLAVAAHAKLKQLETDLTLLEEQQTAVIQGDTDESEKNTHLSQINEQISAKKTEIEVQTQVVLDYEEQSAEKRGEMKEINTELALANQFTEEEWAEVERYIKVDILEDTTFVVTRYSEDYSVIQESHRISDTSCSIGPQNGASPDEPGITISKFNIAVSNKIMYNIEGGYIQTDKISAALIQGTVEVDNDDPTKFVSTFYLGEGMADTRGFQSATLTIYGYFSSLSDNTSPDPDIPEIIGSGTTLNITVSSGDLFITDDLTIYQQRSVEWRLLEWGQDTLNKLAYPTYTFDINSENFLSLDEFDYFRSNLELGAKCYIEMTDGQVLEPILTGVECTYSDLSDLVLEFSNSYVSNDPSFQMKDLLDKAISMGSRVDYSKYTYSAFVDSGAQTAVNDFINSALDTAKNEIMSSTNQAITWNGNGMRFRKWNSDHSDYEPEQIWAINNQIVFSDDGFDSVKTAIGKIKIGDAWVYGIVAEAIVGHLLAGNNLIIESEKKDDSGVSVFKVDGEGASLHNAVFDVYNGTHTHLSINPYFGIAIGHYPVYSESDDGEYVVDDDNAVFWVDLNGDLHIKGTLEVGSNGYFGGIIRALDFQDLNGNSMMINPDNDDDYKFKADYLDLKGITVRDNYGNITFQVDSNGNVSIDGDVTMASGSISWSQLGSSVQTTINNAQNTANSAQSTANNANDNVYDLASGQYTQAGRTFINGTTIYSPNLRFGTNGNYGYLSTDYGNNGVQSTDLIVLHGDKGLRIEAKGGGLALQAEDGVWTEDSEWNMGVVNIKTVNDSNARSTHLKGYIYVDRWSIENDLYFYIARFRAQINSLSTALTNAGITFDRTPWDDSWQPD